MIRVKITIGADRRSATIDFTGTSAAAARATSTRPPRSCTAAVLYVFRTLVDDDIPLNAGCLKPLEVIIPEGSMLNPRPPAATVAGNVETSQCLTDALYGALGRDGRLLRHDEQLHLRQRALPVLRDRSPAAPARAPGFDGTDTVQTHMTNSRLTDPEVLEWRFPVRIDELRDPRGSGGAGQLARRRRRARGACASSSR